MKLFEDYFNERQTGVSFNTGDLVQYFGRSQNIGTVSSPKKLKHQQYLTCHQSILAQESFAFINDPKDSKEISGKMDSLSVDFEADRSVTEIHGMFRQAYEI